MKNNTQKSIKGSVFGLLSAIFIGMTSISYADDTDIFDFEESPIPPNILFLLDGSSSMDEPVAGTSDNRMQVLKGALNDLIADPDLDKINIGLMSFANTIDNDPLSYDPDHSVHGPSYPVSNVMGDTNGDGIQDQTALQVLSQNGVLTQLTDSFLPMPLAGENTRQYAPHVIDQWSTGGGTPIVGALFEAAKYMRGEAIHWGNLVPNRLESAHPSTYRGSHLADGSLTGTQVCSGNTTCYEVGSPSVVANHKRCDSTQTVSGCASKNILAGYNYQSTDNATNTCTLITTRWETCPTTTAICGIATNISECSLHNGVAAYTRNGVGCNKATVDLCNAEPALSNCVTNGELSGFVCDKAIDAVPARLSCPSVKQWKCPVYENVQKCQQQSCQTGYASDLNYHSPINKECQNNAIILLSDGGPSVSRSAPLVSDMIGSSYANNCKNTTTPADMYDWNAPDTIKYYGRCGPELAEFLANTDNSDASLGHNVAGDQPINLYTIGFALQDEPAAEQYLIDLADAGGGEFYTAADRARLILAFKNAISGVSKQARIFSSPTYQVNNTSALLHGENVYLPVFNPQGGTRWSGNLKKFKQLNGELVYGPSNVSIFDTNGNITTDAQDLWATGPSTHPVKGGGAANKIDPDTRKILTDKNINNTGLIPLNALNASLADLGASDAAEQAKLIEYAKGYKADGSTARHSMGDIIHSKPIYFPYDGLSRAKGGIVFVGTNEGYLHAINESDGTEVFAYMPKELLKNIKVLKDNDINVKHPYGVDGLITLNFDDVNNNGKVESGDKVMLYFGLRRGGKSYYALDVTDPTSPQLKWKIKPGTSTDFGELGFTWSKPKLAKMRYGTPKTIKPVLIFGGGYVDDNTPVNEADNSGTGSNVYIVNADTGDLVWKASDTAISYAVASNIRDVDTDRNGTVDRLYFGDTGGFIWRVDLNVSDTAKNALGSYGSVKGRLFSIADLGDAGTGVSRRKFFNAPDVALFRRNGGVSVSVAIGSGDRANPRDQQADDRFFVLLDKHPLNVPTTDPSIIVLGDLGPRKSPTLSGWQLDLDTASGEKVLSTALTFQNNVIFTTFGVGATTIPTAANDCRVSGGNQSRIYIVDLLTGKAVLDLHPDVDPSDPSIITGTIDDDDISVPGREGMIMETPQVVFTKMEAKDGTACVKGNCIRGFSIPGVATNRTKGASAGLKDSLPRTFWINQN